MAHASKEAVYLSNMKAKLGFGRLFESVLLFGDNTAALHIAGNSPYSSHTKHIALRFFYVVELVKDGYAGSPGGLSGYPRAWYRSVS